MRLNNIQRHRILALFYSPEFNLIKNRYKLVCNAAKNENISLTHQGLRNLVKKYEQTGHVRDHIRKNSKTLISNRGLLAINRLLINNSFLTAKSIKVL